MSPILVRPVREQLDHDRVIRLLQVKYRRKFAVAINPGNERTTPAAAGPSPWYPDLVLQSADRGRRLLGTVEVETAESVNNLEAMSQWAAFSRLRAPFHLYIPVSSVDTAKRLCTGLQISVDEIWAYNTLGDQIRFTLVQQSAVGKSRPPVASRPATRAKRPSAPRLARSGRKAAGKRVGKKRVVRAPGIAKAARAKKAAGAAKAARGTRKASRSSRPKKRK